MSDLNKRRLWMIVTIFSMALACGIILGCIAKSADWNANVLLLLVGLAVGIAVTAFHRLNISEIIGMALLATAFGVATFSWINSPPLWQAEDEVVDVEIDNLCVMVQAMQICYEKKIMGVFDFKDVPDPVRKEAQQQVALMSPPEKLRLCNRIYGKRINHTLTGSSTTVWNRRLWMGLALIVSILPAMIKHRRSCHNPTQKGGINVKNCSYFI